MIAVDEFTEAPAARRPVIGALAAVAYLAAIVGANLLIQRFGPVPVGLGLLAPAGVYAVGVVLVLRDLVQWSVGKRAALIALAAGVVLSYVLTDPRLAIASAVAFGLSELVDFAVFTWLAPRWTRAVFFGGLAGLVLDSVVFLALAFGSMEFLPGQILGKLYGVGAAAVIVGVRRRYSR
jgi:hypothetical protein